MQYIKTIIDERGKVEINVALWVTDQFNRKDASGSLFRYDTFTMVTPKGKRKAIYSPDGAHVATDAEILQAKTELWESLKPTQP